MQIQVCSFLLARSSPSAKPNCFSIFPFTELQHIYPLSIYHHDLLVPSSSFSSTPGCSRPLTSSPTLRRDSELWQLFFCRAPKLLEHSVSLPACLPPRPSPAAKLWDRAAVGRRQPAHLSGGQAGGREPETDLIKGRRPGGDQRDGDTHLNNSGTNKSFGLGSLQAGREGSILVYFLLPLMQNAVLLNNPMLIN